MTSKLYSILYNSKDLDLRTRIKLGEVRCALYSWSTGERICSGKGSTPEAAEDDLVSAYESLP